MALEFPKEWRYDPSLGAMPAAAIAELVGLIEKVATQAESPKAVYEIFKGRFGNSSTSSSESWAHSDMVDAMQGAENNVPEFLDAYWAAIEETGQFVDAPPAERVNSVLRKHGVGYAIYPPKLAREVSPAISMDEGGVTPAPPPGYIIGERLGGGAFGEVFLARRHTAFCDFEFAIKFHRPSAFADPERARARFQREAVALSKLQHRGIVAYSDAGIDANGQPFLTMSLIKGSNLRDATEGANSRTAVAYMLEVLDAIEYAHRNGVLHRDLKPTNILVRRTDSQPVIVDFGLAYIIDDLGQADLTLSGIGTGPYVPHESLANPMLRRPAHDVYSCGVILYEILARRLPDPSHYIELALLNPSWAGLDPVIRRALARVDLRFESAGSFRDALRQAASA